MRWRTGQDFTPNLLCYNQYESENNIYQYNAVVERVVDGDTIHVTTDLGFDLQFTMTLRLYGINAPEKSGATKDAGLAAKDYLTTRLPVGTNVIIDTFKDKKEKFGRYLANVTEGATLINKEMVNRGFAVPYFGGAR